MLKIFFGAISLALLAQASLCQAEAQTPVELCRQRNSASCEVSGLKFFIDDDCPKGAKVLRPHGKERCDDLAAKTDSAVKPQSDAVAAQPAMQHAASLPAKEAEDDTAYSWWPVLLLAVFGLLFGLYIKTGER